MVEQVGGQITFEYEGVDLPDLPFVKVKRWITEIIKLHDYRVGEICYIFCHDQKILEVNKQFLNHDYYTDIISFDYTEDNIISGDLFLSLDTIKSNSIKFSTHFKSELLRVIIHGVLHLCGLKDKSEADSKQMRKAEDEALLIYNAF